MGVGRDITAASATRSSEKFSEKTKLDGPNTKEGGYLTWQAWGLCAGVSFWTHMLWS